jgi:hypothetical protein
LCQRDPTIHPGLFSEFTVVCIHHVHARVKLSSFGTLALG